jgi:hypothetical protein
MLAENMDLILLRDVVNDHSTRTPGTRELTELRMQTHDVSSLYLRFLHRCCWEVREDIEFFFLFRFGVRQTRNFSTNERVIVIAYFGYQGRGCYGW